MTTVQRPYNDRLIRRITNRPLTSRVRGELVLCFVPGRLCHGPRSRSSRALFKKPGDSTFIWATLC